MTQTEIAPHEAFELHELLQLKNSCALKASGLTNDISDPKLRVILETDLRNSQEQIKELQEFIRQAVNLAE
ncbi:MAG TPA: hypothetical protein GXX46_03465 [Peptococcaceae bacterium]|nr:hypothetical protein [Peptococcaceae bacterium]